MRQKVGSATTALLLMAGITAAATPKLEVVSAAPQGVLAGDEVSRVQIVFSTAVVPLGEAQEMTRPPVWLAVEPPVLARWRWAGTAELVGEPLAPLPRATTYKLTVSPELSGVGGATLGTPFVFTFTTPLPVAEIEREDQGEDEAGDALGFAVALRFNQPVDPASVAQALDVRVEPRALPDAAALIPAATAHAWEEAGSQTWTAWQRFLEEARGARPGRPDFLLEPDADKPHETFYVKPLGCWPTAATLHVRLAPGVRSLEGPLSSAVEVKEGLSTPWPFAPRHFSGRKLAPDGPWDPQSLELTFSVPVTWRDLAPFLRYRTAGEERWHVLPTQGDEWWWDHGATDLRLGVLGLGGGQTVEVCLGPEARDTLGRELGFEWCGQAPTGHRPPFFYLVEGDGVVEWDGPHLLPLRSLNVESYRLRQRRIAEEELVGWLERRHRPAPTTPSSGELVTLRRPADHADLTPVDLGPVLGGKPGIVLTEVQVESVVPGSEYEGGEARWLREPRACLTQVTSLGLTVKTSRHEGILVWVTRLAEATPVEGAEVVVRDTGGGELWRGRTDARGLAQTPPSLNANTTSLVTARVGDDLAYARTRWYEGHRGWDFNLPVDWADTPRVSGLVWPDRGVVRPGERVHVKAVLRHPGERALAFPSERTVSFVAWDSRNTAVAVQEAAVDRWGTAEAELEIPEAAALGAWEVMVGPHFNRDTGGWEGDDTWTLSTTLRVAHFRRPKLRVRTTLEAERLVAGEPLHATIEGTLLAGGAMAGAPARWAVRAERGGFAPPGAQWNGFEWMPAAWLDLYEYEELQVVAEGQGTLDRTGKLPVHLPRAEALKGWPARVQVEGEVTDLDRQSSASTASLLVLPGEFSLGIQRPGYFLQAHKGVGSAVIAVHPDGSPVPGVAVTVTLLRRHWESVRRREVSGRYVYESRPVQETVATRPLTTGAEPVAVRFDLAEGGEYALAVEATDPHSNRVTASTDFYVLGAGYTPWRMDQENRIDLVPERPSYNPGETARVLVKSPWEAATALVTVERAGVLESRVESLAGTMPVLAVPVTAEHTPNVFVSVVLLRGRVESAPDPEMVDPGRPAYRIGACAISVPPLGRRLKVEVTPAKPEYRPGQQATASIRVTGEDGTPRQAGVTVWAVDAGVLELTAYRTPDPFHTLYAERGLGVATAESRSRLVGRRSYGTKGDKSGGGGGREAGMEVRQDFRALAVWRGDVVTDTQGRAEVSFTLPDSLTTYRLMAVAVASASEVGSGAAEVLVSKPLGLEPALPRFLRPDDRARAGVLVRNRTRETREVEVTLTLDASGPVTLRGTPTRIATVPPGGTAEVGFGLVGASPGLARLRFTLTSPRPTPQSDAFELTVPVIALAPSETMATFFAVGERAEEAVAVPGDAFPGVGGLELRVASSLLVEASGGIDFLLDYPHACAEQVASQILGFTAGSRLGGSLAPRDSRGIGGPVWTGKAVARLLACQRTDGGFAFWPDGRASSSELSAHVVWALVAARKAGATVDEAALQRATQHLSNLLRRESWPGGPAHGWTVRALALHALAAAGKPEPAYLQGLYEKRAAAPLWGRALLAAMVAATSGSDPRLRVLQQELRNRLAVEARVARLDETPPDWGFLVWSSEPRASASALLAIAAERATDPLTDRLVRGLVDHLGRDRTRSTHDTAWMLQALADWQDRRGGPAGVRSVGADLGGEKLLAASLDAANPATVAQVTMAELQRRAQKAGGAPLPLVVRSSGGESQAVAVLRVTPRASRPPLAQGIALSRRLLDVGDRAVRGAPAGSELRLEIAVTCPATRRFVAVEVPLPAGLEAVDPELATTARRDDAAEEEGETEAGDWLWWRPGFDHVELRDDRVMLYASELAAGTTTIRVRCRATTSGTYTLGPARAEEMYAPEIFATAAAGTFEVTPAGR